MPAILVVLFIVVPLLEIVMIIQVGQAIGAWWTVAILVADSLLGAWLLRREGARAWRDFRQALADGRWPGDEVAQGSMVIVGGTLLLTPGFITDVVGFVLLIPVSRRVASRTVRGRLGARTPGSSRRRRSGDRGSPGGGEPRPSSAGVLDVEVVEIRREERQEIDRPQDDPPFGPGDR